jgi:acetoin utilization protein AcuB
MYPKTVIELMSSPVRTLKTSDSLRKALNLLNKERIRHAPVLKDDRLVGIVSDRDVRMYLPPPISSGHQEESVSILDKIRVNEMMTGNPISIGPYHSVKEAARILLERRIGALPVVKEGRVIGIVTRSGILEAMFSQVQRLEGENASPADASSNRRKSPKR